MTTLELTLWSIVVIAILIALGFAVSIKLRSIEEMRNAAQTWEANEAARRIREHRYLTERVDANRDKLRARVDEMRREDPFKRAIAADDSPWPPNDPPYWSEAVGALDPWEADTSPAPASDYSSSDCSSADSSASSCSGGGE